MKQVQIYNSTIFLAFVFCMFSMGSVGTVFAQEGTMASGFGQGKYSIGSELHIDPRVENVTTLLSEDVTMILWGVSGIEIDSAVFNLKARSALERKILDNKILCTIKSVVSRNVFKAQCINKDEEDLSLYLLQQGYVTANREEVQETVYERPYINAEAFAQENNAGAWGFGASGEPSEADVQTQNFMMGSLGLMAVFVLAIGALSLHIMRGFRRVTDLQNKSIELAAKERSLREKEREIIATMVHAEIKSNISKIDAYLTIYEETLEDFKDPDRPPKYQKTGDILQRQPALDRSVFDGNTSKLDLLGSDVASDVIHYYARIKTNPDYIEINPDTPQEEVRNTIERAISNAKKMKEISDKLLGTFASNRLVQEVQF